MAPEEAYFFALDNPGCDIRKYQEFACAYSYFAYWFARDIPNSNIEYCQRHCFKDPFEAYMFARDIQEADIEYCYNFASNDRKRDIERFVLKDL